jgi:hypothetical protein
MTRPASLAASIVILLCAIAPARSQEALPRLAEVGPWPAVSGLVGYGGRLWLVNGVKGRNHNSADLYSYDPASGRLRYERHLFSQDAGAPLVFGALLYWPFEDPRASLGWGQFLVTDGTGWRLGTIPTAEIFHVHDLAAVGGRLVAATSAWRAGLQVSDDGGLTWREIYDHPTPEKRVSRITELIEVNGRVLAYLTQRSGQRVLVLDGDSVEELAGWPKDRPLRAWALLDGWVYGLVEEAGGTAVWRSDGARVEPVAPARAGWRPRALAAGDGALWAVGVEGDGGLLWRSTDGRDWEAVGRIAGARPGAVQVHEGVVYVGGTDAEGRGALWGRSLGEPMPSRPSTNASSLEGFFGGGRPAPEPWRPVVARLDQALADPASYAHHGERLRDLAFELAMARPPAEVWRDRMMRKVPDIELSLIGGKTTARGEDLAQWILLWGLSLAGEGEVPAAWLAEPWTGEPNPSEKYFAPAPAAIWTAAVIGQNDAATIGALVDRLDRPGDPPWLTGDVVGALTALTGERFGYDAAGWRAWWAEARK